jgi:hypothetical protein
MPGMAMENTLQMEWCLSCHKNPENFLRPKSEIFNTAYNPATELTAEERLKLKEDYKIRSREMMTSCSVCHR